MINRFPSPALLTFVLACACGLSAQTHVPASGPAPQSAATPGAAAEAATHTITLDVVAAHKSQPPVADLPQAAFSLLDNKTPRPITSFKAFSGDNTPVSVILIIDAVNANFSTVAQSREQVDHFLKANEGHLSHPTTLAIFSDTGLALQPTYTRDGNALAESLDHQTIGLRDIRRSSGFEGAEERTQLSLNTLSQLALSESKVPGRKLVLWVSPGWPLLSGVRVDLDTKQTESVFREAVEFSALLRQARITLYSVDPIGAAESLGRTFLYEEYVKGLSKPSQAELGDLALQVLAVQSGGLALAGSNDIGGMIRSAYEDGSAYYELTFNPPAAERPNEYHQIELQVTQPGLSVRTRQGYYNQP